MKKLFSSTSALFQFPLFSGGGVGERDSAVPEVTVLNLWLKVS